MTTPVSPVDPPPIGAEPIAPPGPAPAPDGAPTSQDIRDLVASMQRQVTDAIPSPPFRKAIVTAVNNGTSPPTIDIQYPPSTLADGTAGTPVTISSIRYIDSFSPVVGDTVILGVVGTDVFGLGQIQNAGYGSTVNGWIIAGGCRYRVVADNGEFKVQMQGSYTPGGSVNLFVVDPTCRPGLTRNFVLPTNGNMSYVRVQVASGTGQVSIIGATSLQATDSGGNNATSSVDPSDVTNFVDAGWSDYRDAAWSDVRLSGYLSQAGTDLGHQHYTGSHQHYTGSHQHSVLGSHSHAGPSHTHTVSPSLPGTVWFDSIEYFL